MSPEEQAAVGAFAGQHVTTGPQAEAFARYIQGHLALVNEGKTYSETSAAARVEGLDAKTAADLQAKADTLFKGETLRSILLNALRLVDGRDDRPVRRVRHGRSRGIALMVLGRSWASGTRRRPPSS